MYAIYADSKGEEFPLKVVSELRNIEIVRTDLLNPIVFAELETISY